MIKNRNIIVSTTNTLEGTEIKEYLGIVSSHVVAGTNIFSDIFASFSDIFGGRSQSYQKQLTSINDEAINLLKNKALSLGANGIMGLSIDHDEVSGGNKSMFMVTAIGTAVKIETSKLFPTKHSGVIRRFDFEEMQIQIKKNEIIEQADSSSFLQNDSIDWNFLKEHSVIELAPKILQILDTVSDNRSKYYYFRKPMIEKAIEFYQTIPEEEAKPYLYKALLIEQRDIRSDFITLIGKLKLLDLDLVFSLINSDSFDLKKCGLQLLQFDKAMYSIEDIPMFKKIKNLIENGFPERGQRYIKKSVLSHNKEKWKCECGEESNDVEYCAKCGNDIKGFSSTDLKPEEASKLVVTKLTVLNNLANNLQHGGV